MKNRIFWVVAIVCLVIDQLTKYWVVQNFELTESLPLLPGIFQLTYVTNTGAAFSLFQGVGWLRWLSLAVSIGLMAFAWFGSVLKSFEQLGLGLILGGALGNGIDRFFNTCIVDGQVLTCVVDFLHFSLIEFPVFNFADVFINLGIICLLIASWKEQSPTSDRRSPGSEHTKRDRK
ncbi:MAG: lipoprotein signal peptidase [Symploca sp. SIO2E6]|nr:lipoprotein signal peptidase [Symploca sp. SIO2E6]